MTVIWFLLCAWARSGRRELTSYVGRVVLWCRSAPAAADERQAKSLSTKRDYLSAKRLARREAGRVRDARAGGGTRAA
ncbi:hypothetical protein Msi02_66650 [Microbispora siamensis]|uniref:Uncharacterized protein n=1 Tax=Microbispora siamensis TaxID=564413 RepID=A0ABQ4GWQ3_9ACTN|nr:hypothetical protein Msi02_66650 [Microbispora siamensis]